MRIFNTGQISPEEKQSILEKHKSLYNGYQAMYPQVSNEQPLYVYDAAQDKNGVTMDNKGNIKPYTNYRINESKEQMCSECGSEMYEGECSECGWKGDMEEDECMECGSEMYEEKGMCSECGSEMYEGECSECGWKGDMEEGKLEDLKDKALDWMKKEGDSKLEKAIKKFGDFLVDLEDELDGTKKPKKKETKEGKGHLSDIYNVKDLGNSDFDYVEGGGNDYGTFEKMHHMKESTATSNAPVSLGKHYSEIEEPYDFNSNGPIGDGKTLRQKNIGEQGMFGGGHAADYDMDAKPAYNFRSKGSKMGDGPYDQEADDMDLDQDKEWNSYDFESDGPIDSYPMFEDEFTDLIDTDNELEDEREELEEKEYEGMTSAFADDDELDEQMKMAKIGDVGEQDVSGAQGLYGDMKKAYNFQSTGAGKAGPYQRSNWTEGEDYEEEGGYEGENEDVYWEKDLDDNELDLDLTKFNPEDASWEEIKAHTGNWDEIDEDLQESFIRQKEKINEMFNRMRIFK